MSDLTTSTNGTIEDVASFFRVVVRTVQEWKGRRLIGSCQQGRVVVFLEEHVVEFGADPGRFTWPSRLDPGTAAETVRRQWREHLRLRAAMSVEARVSCLEEELALLRAERQPA